MKFYFPNAKKKHIFTIFSICYKNIERSWRYNSFTKLSILFNKLTNYNLFIFQKKIKIKVCFTFNQVTAYYFGKMKEKYHLNIKISLTIIVMGLTKTVN